eukprot:COSAG01_NODE_5269_length_4369_cov_15.316159_4_plen_104_part_00
MAKSVVETVMHEYTNHALITSHTTSLVPARLLPLGQQWPPTARRASFSQLLAPQPTPKPHHLRHLIRHTPVRERACAQATPRRARALQRQLVGAGGAAMATSQ